MQVFRGRLADFANGIHVYHKRWDTAGEIGRGRPGGLSRGGRSPVRGGAPPCPSSPAPSSPCPKRRRASPDFASSIRSFSRDNGVKGCRPTVVGATPMLGV